MFRRNTGTPRHVSALIETSTAPRARSTCSIMRPTGSAAATNTSPESSPARKRTSCTWIESTITRSPTFVYDTGIVSRSRCSSRLSSGSRFAIEYVGSSLNRNVSSCVYHHST